MHGTVLFRYLFRMSNIKIPSIQEVRIDWDQYSHQYNTFDVGPQTFFFSLVNILNLHSATNILEVACGTEKLLPYALEKKHLNSKYLASDLSSNMIGLAKQNFQAHFARYNSRYTFQQWCEKQKIRFKVINGEEPIQEEEQFDRIICNNPKKMMENLNKQAKKGCLFGLSVWGNKLQNNFFMAINESIVQNNVEPPAERSKFYLNKQVGELAAQTGWEVVLNWQQSALFPVLQYSPQHNKELFQYRVNKFPQPQHSKILATLQKKLTAFFAAKQGVNLASQMFVLCKK